MCVNQYNSDKPSWKFKSPNVVCLSFQFVFFHHPVGGICPSAFPPAESSAWAGLIVPVIFPLLLIVTSFSKKINKFVFNCECMSSA